MRYSLVKRLEKLEQQFDLVREERLPSELAGELLQLFRTGTMSRVGDPLDIIDEVRWLPPSKQCEVIGYFIDGAMAMNPASSWAELDAFWSLMHLPWPPPLGDTTE